METISIIADVCGILGFVISLFAISSVVKIKRTIKSTNNSNNQTARGKDNKQTITTNK